MLITLLYLSSRQNPSRNAGDHGQFDYYAIVSITIKLRLVYTACYKRTELIVSEMIRLQNAV